MLIDTELSLGLLAGHRNAQQPKHRYGTNETIAWSNFAKIDIRTGTIIAAEIFKEASQPTYKLRIDFGALGNKKSSAKLNKRYAVEE